MTPNTTKTSVANLVQIFEDRLLDLDERTAHAALTYFVSLLERGFGRAGDEPVPTLQKVELATWADDAGSGEITQSLQVSLCPQPVRITKTAAATGRSLLSNGFLGADLIHVPAGDGFAPHTHPGDHLLFVVGGYGTITIGGEIVQTKPGQAYLVEGRVPHAVGALTDHVLIAIGAPHRRLVSDDRQSLVASGLLTDDGSITCTICNVIASGIDDLAARGCRHGPREFE